MTYGSLFSGIGGMDLGLDRAGMECRFQVEIYPYCRKVLEKHWPNVRRYEDVRTVGAELERVDLIAGGFPCQDLSRAGKGAGIEGARSGLWREYFRIICLLRPRFVLVENVSGLLDGGIGRVLGNLAQIGMDAEWRCLGTEDFGAPSPRQRVFILAYPAGYRLERNGGFLLQGPDCGALEALDAWNRSSSPFREWKKLLAQPRVIRVAGGFAARVDRPKQRLKAIGNSVSPQVAEWVGRRIMEAAR